MVLDKYEQEIKVQEKKLKIRELTWQIELLASLQPGAVTLALEEAEICIDLAGHPLNVARAILDAFAARSFVGLVDFLTKLSDELSLDLPGPAVSEIIKSWLSVLSSISDEDLYGFMKDDYEYCCLSSGNEILVSTTSGVQVRSMRLFTPMSLYRLGQSVDTSNPERDSYTRRVITQLTSNGPYRRFSFEEEVPIKLEQLKTKVPNFTGVIDYVMDALSLAIRYQKPIRITPMLLVGDPGIGKSYFTNQLSTCLGVPERRVAMDNLQIGAGLAGSSHIYSNSETGVVFKVLTEESHISPLVILDEIDKVSGNSSHGDPLSPLHNLLEPTCSKSFIDASVNLPIDASHVIWIATANYLDRIPVALRSRFQIFEVSSQSPGARKEIVKTICEELSLEYPGVEFEQDLVSKLSEGTPREQRQMLQRALARAVRLGATKVSLDHLNQVIPEMQSQSSSRSLGFRGIIG